MKNRISKDGEKVEVIAVFGETRLVRVQGWLELQGGSMTERMEALEWMSVFLPDELAHVQR